ncbi:MAG TPA: FAD-binding oxidoreductase [Reyranella sp.]|jgi:glycine/D-amino acid oxidase-like deaminating enzyme|nr:FAD-binding oxidoreductase [Reyranella sp.]
MSTLGRRRLLQSSLLGSGLLSACAAPPPTSNLAAIKARTDRIFDMAVCLRPFRAAGPRLDSERLGNTLVVHNYGHGGSGWSLSWGSSTIAVAKAMQASPREIAVIGCGALGLTSAILAQRAGAKVTIYAREQIMDTRSFRASGAWTPDSRIALTSAADPGFAALWEEMARTSFKTHREFLGLPGTPVEWADYYSIRTDDPPPPPAGGPAPLPFASYSRRIADLMPRARKVPAEQAPFRADAVYQSEFMIFNIADYGHTLLNDFFTAGGRFRHADFRSPTEIAALGYRVVINCTGYGARALWKDESVVPVRGQVARLIPQSDVHYGLDYKHVYVVPRRDGIIVQDVSGGDMKGYGETDETIDRAESDHAVTTLAELFSPARWRGAPYTA